MFSAEKDAESGKWFVFFETETGELQRTSDAPDEFHSEQEARLAANQLNKKLLMDSETTNIAEDAVEVKDGDRQAAYGDAVINHKRIARMWSDIIGAPVTAKQVALCMIQVKISREINAPSRDNLVDLVGYALVAEDIDNG